MNYKISIIIPVYNVGIYIREALTSIERQSLSFEDIEVVMVNDCSTDDSGEIMNEYSNRYSNCISVHLPERSGASGKPRNVGIERATGNYIMFLDPDDYYEENACQLLFNAIERDQSDLVVGRYRYVNSSILGKWLKEDDLIVENIDHHPEILELSPTIWTKIFRSSFIKENNISFPEKIVAQDLVFYVHSCLAAQKISFYNYIICNYRVWDESISNVLTYNYFNGLNEAYKYARNLCIHYRKPYLYEHIIRSTLEYVTNKLVQVNNLSKQELLNILQNMQWYFKMVSKSQIISTELWQQGLIDKLSNEQYDQFLELKDIVLNFRTYILEIEKGKNWLEQQLSNYQTEVEGLKNHAKLLEEEMKKAKSYVMELEQGKSWLEQQYNKNKIEVIELQENNSILQNNLKALQQQYVELNDRFIDITSLGGWIKYHRKRK